MATIFKKLVMPKFVRSEKDGEDSHDLAPEENEAEHSNLTLEDIQLAKMSLLQGLLVLSSCLGTIAVLVGLLTLPMTTVVYSAVTTAVCNLVLLCGICCLVCVLGYKHNSGQRDKHLLELMNHGVVALAGLNILGMALSIGSETPEEGGWVLEKGNSSVVCF